MSIKSKQRRKKYLKAKNIKNHNLPKMAKNIRFSSHRLTMKEALQIIK